MTTNRTGLSTLSDERLELFISKPLDNGLTRGEQMELVRELLAYRKASSDPVADAVAWNKPGEERKCDIRWRRFDVAPGPLFTAPPLAVTVPDWWKLTPIEPTAEMCEIWHIGIDVCAGSATDGEYYSVCGDDAAKVYKAMLKLAPEYKK